MAAGGIVAGVKAMLAYVAKVAGLWQRNIGGSCLKSSSRNGIENNGVAKKMAA
jgi:hypothetical protein